MKTKLALSLLCFSLVFANSALAKTKTVLPDACGDDGVKFEVKTESDQPAPAGPEAGKAQIVFANMPGAYRNNMSFPTVRFGLDGAWVGANRGDSYFAVTIDPGVRNLCVSVQGVPRGLAKILVDQATFTAEAGKVYFYEAQFNVIGGANGGGVESFGLVPLSDADGKYRIKAWKLATWKSK